MLLHKNMFLVLLIIKVKTSSQVPKNDDNSENIQDDNNIEISSPDLKLEHYEGRSTYYKSDEIFDNDLCDRVLHDDLEKSFSENKIKNDEKQENDSEALVALTVKHHEKKRGTGSQLDDDTDYGNYPKCGSLNMRSFYQCHCGNTTLKNIAPSNEYCCVDPVAAVQCHYNTDGDRNSYLFRRDQRWSDVTCRGGIVKNKLEPCYKFCNNEYINSQNLASQAHFYCESLNLCIHIRTMCSGICPDEISQCREYLRCLYSGYPWANDYKITVESLNSDVVTNHKYCNRQDNDNTYHQFNRMDEEKITLASETPVDTSILKPCRESEGSPGISCSDADYGCFANVQWCQSDNAVTCKIGNITVSVNDKQLCANTSFWKQHSCDNYQDNQLFVYGSRCSSSGQCYFTYYNRYDGKTSTTPTCKDGSHQKFPLNTTCQDFNSQFRKQHNNQWCECDDIYSRGCIEAKSRDICQNPDKWFAEQTDAFILDPHQCQLSCKDPGVNCTSCTNTEDFFICPKSGYCVDKKVRCDGHANCHLREDEENCAKEYVKKNIFKNYATYKCLSAIYPGKFCLSQNSWYQGNSQR